MTVTKLVDMIDPEVMADTVSAELPNAIRFTPLATVFNDLQGNPGSVLKVPSYSYSGDATDVAEGAAIPIDKMQTSVKEMEIKKVAKGIELTDEAALSGLGDPVGEAVNQITLGIANKVDNDFIEALDDAVQTVTGDIQKVATLQEAIDVFSDEDETQAVLLVNPADASQLATDARSQMMGSDVGANALISGTYIDILGVQVVRSNKVAEGEGYLVKEGALALNMKRNAEIETERASTRKTTIITGDQHYGAYLFDDSKVVKVIASA